MRLRRVRAGLYRTLDGRYEIVKHPQSGNEHGGWGYISWDIYAVGENEPITGSPLRSLGACRDELEAMAADRPIP